MDERQNDNEDKGAADGDHIMISAHVRGTVRLLPRDGDGPCGNVSDVNSNSSQPRLATNLMEDKENDNKDKGTADSDHIKITAYKHEDEGRRASISSITAAATTGQTSFAVNDSNKADEKREDTEEGRVLRREKRASAALIREFREAAGYNAAYEEFPTTLEYKALQSDDSKREVLMGAYFSPEPVLVTVRRAMKVVVLQVAMALALTAVIISYAPALWHTCQSSVFGPAFDIIRRTVRVFLFVMVLLQTTDGHHLQKIISRLKKSWLILAVPLVLNIVIAVAYWRHWNCQWRTHLIGPLLWCCLLLCPYLYFRHAGGSLGIKRKRLYAIKLGAACTLGVLLDAVSFQLFFPRAATTYTDGSKSQLALVFVAIGWSISSLVNKLIRSIREGPPTFNVQPTAIMAIPNVIAPRLLQSKMATFSTKLLYSILISLLDKPLHYRHLTAILDTVLYCR